MTDRDLIGYGGRPPHPERPGGAKLALSLVVNWVARRLDNVRHWIGCFPP
jgi:allantoinase